MQTSPNECRILGAQITLLANEECDEMLAWAQGEATAPQGMPPLRWLLAHCDDGVIWGRYGEEDRWTLSTAVYPSVSPPLRRLTLQELRLFGKGAEILVWRFETGLRGRRLTDAPAPRMAHAIPADDERILVGDRLLAASRDGFSLVGDARGSSHAVPLVCDERDFPGERWPLRLHLRHYFEKRPESGVLRVTASRLLRVSKNNSTARRAGEQRLPG